MQSTTQQKERKKITSSVVLVVIEGPDPKELKIKNFSFFETNSGKSKLSASGIALYQTLHALYLVASASIILPFLTSNERSQFSSIVTKYSTIPNKSFQLLPGVNISVKLNNGASIENIELLGFVENENTDKYIQQLLYQQYDDFYWGWNNSIDNWNNGNRPSRFAVLKVIKNDSLSNDKLLHSVRCIWQTYDETTQQPMINHELNVSNFRTSRNLEQMKSIYVIGSPFGLLSPQTFLNSVTQGIVSNIIRDSRGNALAFLTDARILPGCEGGSVFYKSDGNCVGICTMPIRSRSSQMDLNLVIALDSISSKLFELIRDDLKPNQIIVSPSNTSMQGNPKISSAFGNVKNSIVLVNVADSWSSGVLINDRGLILTNAHLFSPYIISKTSALRPNVSIVVQLDQDISNLQTNHKFFSATLLYMNTTGPFDVALLQIDDKNLNLKHYIELNPGQGMKQGQIIYGVGYPLFHPMSVNATIRTSTITEGTLCKIVKKNGIPILIQTSALIHKGNSGGGIFDENGAFIALVTSNARHRNKNNRDNNDSHSDQESRLIPSLNFALPVSRLGPIANFAKNPAEYSLARVIKEMNEPNEQFARIWRLAREEPKKKSNAKGQSNFMSYLEKMNEQKRQVSREVGSLKEGTPEFINSKL